MTPLELVAFLCGGIGTIIVVFVSPAPSRVMSYQDEEEINRNMAKDRRFRKLYWLGSALLIAGLFVQFALLISKGATENELHPQSAIMTHASSMARLLVKQIVLRPRRFRRVLSVRLWRSIMLIPKTLTRCSAGGIKSR